MLSSDCKKDRLEAGRFCYQIDALDLLLWAWIHPGEFNQPKEGAIVISPGPTGGCPLKFAFRIVPVPHVLAIDNRYFFLTTAGVVNDISTDECAIGTVCVECAIMKKVQPGTFVADLNAPNPWQRIRLRILIV